MHKQFKRIVAVISLIIVLLNLIFFSFRVYDATVFWIVIIIMALVAFPGMKLLDRK